MISTSTAYHQPGIKGIIFDLEPVCKEAQIFIDNSSLPDGTVLTYSGNMFTDDFPLNDNPTYGYQAILYSNVLHDWNDEKCEYLTKKAFDSLPDNGAILIHEALLNDDGNGPLIAACYSFSMFLKSEGKQFTFSELKELLAHSGFKGKFN